MDAGLRPAWILSLLLATCAGCSAHQAGEDAGHKERVERTTAMAITITSSAFQEGNPIPKPHTCEGVDISPPLQWQGVPDSTKSIALICEDPDAPRGTWIHWVLWGLPPTEHALAESVPRDPRLPSGARQGVNDFKETGYRGPCPPPGGPHRYYFRLFALDTIPDPPERASAADLRRAMEGHVIAEGALMGTYRRGSQ